jgi:hypothetical protein
MLSLSFSEVFLVVPPQQLSILSILSKLESRSEEKKLVWPFKQENLPHHPVLLSSSGKFSQVMEFLDSIEVYNLLF